METVTRTSGHLGPNLGVVELTIALHRVFDSPKDKLIFDTGHQSYVHKLLTGRLGRVPHAAADRRPVRLPEPGASPSTTWWRTRHASTSLSYADGMAKAYRLRGEHDRTVVAVIGDGALTGGMAWEALNNIAVARDSRLVIVVNDNGRSYQPTIGGLASHLSSIRVSQRYEHVLDLIKTTVTRTPIVGSPLFGALHGAKKGLKDFLQPQVLFEDLGHQVHRPDRRPRRGDDRARAAPGARVRRPGPRPRDHPQGLRLRPRRAERGGLPPPGPRHRRQAGRPPAAAHGANAAPKPAKRSWSDVYSDEMVAIGARRPDVVAITAAMLHPVGLAPFKAAYPDRVYDVGIAEQHAMTMAAGLAMAGLHPVVSVYATFLNRAFDQLLMDVALHKLPVTVTLDRAGRHRPGRREPQRHVGRLDPPGRPRPAGGGAARRQPDRRAAQRGRRRSATAPPSSAGPRAASAPRSRRSASSARWTCWPCPAEGTGRDVLLLGAGPMAVTCVEVARRLGDHGIGVTVVDPRWVKPVDEAVVGAARAAPAGRGGRGQRPGRRVR